MARKQRYSFQIDRINFVSLAFLLIIGAVCFVNIGHSASAELEEEMLAESTIDASLTEELAGETSPISPETQDTEAPVIATQPQTQTDTVGMDFSLKRLVVHTTNRDTLSNYNGVKQIMGNYYTIDFSSIEETRNAYVNLASSDDIDSVTPDMRVQPLAPQINTIRSYGDEEETGLAWGVQDTGEDLYSYWNSLNENTNTVKVAVIDSGINKDHIVFSGDRIVMTESTKNYITGAASPTDDNGHGTGVAGVIAESTPDNVKIYPSKVLNANGETNDQTGMTDILYAVANATEKDKVDIINLSLGVNGEGSEPAPSCNTGELSLFNSFFGEVVNQGTLVIAAAGNDAKNSVSFPANCSNVVAVSAINQGRTFANSYSNYGPEIEFAMPGTALNIPWIMLQDQTIPAGVTNENITITASGTSFAAPFLSAAAALIKTEHPDYGPAQIVNALKQNAVSYNDAQRFGNGVVDFGEKMFKTPKINVKPLATDWTKSDSLRVIFVSTNKVTNFALTRNSQTPTSWENIPSGGAQYYRGTLDNITDNGSYNFWVKTATNTTSNLSATVTYVDNLSPNIVSGPEISSTDDGEITIGANIYDSQSGLKSATLYYRKKSSGSRYTNVSQNFNNANTQTSAKFTLSGLEEGTDYEYYIRAADALGNASNSSTAFFTAPTITAAATTPNTLPEANGTQSNTTTTPEAVKTSSNVDSPITVDSISTSVSAFAVASTATILIFYYATRRRR